MFLPSGYEVSHDPAVYIAIVLCIFILALWADKDTIYLRHRKDDDAD